MDGDYDYKQAIKTRQKIITEIADKETMLIGSHFSDPVAGYVINSKDGYVFKT